MRLHQYLQKIILTTQHHHQLQQLEQLQLQAAIEEESDRLQQAHAAEAEDKARGGLAASRTRVRELEKQVGAGSRK